MSVDLVSTSETNVTVSLDPAANTLDGELLGKLQARSRRSCAACRSSGPAPPCRSSAATSARSCTSSATPSRCSRSRRSICVSQAANDLNFTFVVDENQGDRLVEQLHDLLIRPLPGDPVLGPTWEQLFAKPEARGGARAAVVGARSATQLARRARRSATAPTSTTSRRCDAAAKAITRHQVDRPRAVRAQGQSASGDPAHASPPRGSASIACRSRRSSACSKRCPGISPGSHPVHAELRAARGIRARARARRARHHRQPVRAAALARRLQGQERVPAHRHRHRPRPSPSREDGRRAVEVRHSRRGARRSRAPREGRRRHDRRPACACRQRRVRRRQLDAGRLGARRPREAISRT